MLGEESNQVLTSIMQHEPFSETKVRLEKRTGIKGRSFEKIKFAVIRRSTYPKTTYLNDGKLRRGAVLMRWRPAINSNTMADDILWDVASQEDMLGLDHPDRSVNRRNGLGDLFLR